jgi:hypothetical protein
VPVGAPVAAAADPFAGVEFAEASAGAQSSRRPARKRRFAGFLAGAAGLLLCVAAGLWWRSERVETRIEWGRRTPDRSVAQAVHSSRGAISYERRTYVRDDARQAPAGFAPARIERPATTSRLDEPGWTERRRGLGFGYNSDLSGRREREGRLYHWEVIVPYWALCAVLAVPVLISFARRARRKG